MLSLGGAGPRSGRAESSDAMKRCVEGASDSVLRFPPPLLVHRVLCAVKFVVLLGMAFWLGFVQGSAAKDKEKAIGFFF